MRLISRCALCMDQVVLHALLLLFRFKIQSIDVLGLPTIDDIRDSCIGIFKVNR